MYQVNWSGLSETICSEKDLSAHKSVIGQPLLVPQVKNHNSYKNIALHYFIPVYMVMCTTIQSTASGFRDMGHYLVLGHFRWFDYGGMLFQ